MKTRGVADKCKNSLELKQDDFHEAFQNETFIRANEKYPKSYMRTTDSSGFYKSRLNDNNKDSPFDREGKDVICG